MIRAILDLVMKKTNPFKLPQAFLNQLDEFTKGYYLVTINDKNQFEINFQYPDQVTELALLNFVDMQSSCVQEVMRQRAVDRSLGDEEDEGEVS